ncbi:hypothetical protein BJF88_12610 [Cellulosimicrobium sp. CUA-896]|nr:hypothetical protein BJF88_12610 [Cellulosimicrobium sp. CUA-896]
MVREVVQRRVLVLGNALLRRRRQHDALDDERRPVDRARPRDAGERLLEVPVDDEASCSTDSTWCGSAGRRGEGVGRQAVRERGVVREGARGAHEREEPRRCVPARGRGVRLDLVDREGECALRGRQARPVGRVRRGDLVRAGARGVVGVRHAPIVPERRPPRAWEP